MSTTSEPQAATIGDPGLTLRLYRVALRMSQKELAARVGISRQAITLIESSRCTPHALTRAAIARVLEEDEAVLFPGVAARRP